MSGSEGRLEIEFREPYPVYRGLRVPVWEGGRPVSVRRVTDDDRRAFREALEKLRNLLERVSKLAGGISEEERLELLADTIVHFLKAPLIQEVSPVAPTPLKAHALELLAPWLKREFWSDDLYEFAKRLAELSREELRAFEELFQPDTAELVFKLWVAFPADTRPGYNTSSLVAHSLMTSAIAWALSYGSDRRARALTRLAALLHDLGKAVDPERHYEASEALARRLLEGLVDGETLKQLAAVVREHHLRESVVSRADRYASAADRLRELVERAIGDKLSKMEELLGMPGGREEWRFWARLYEEIRELAKAGLAREDPIRELTEEFLRKVPELAREKPTKRPERVEGLSLVLIDVASIQEFVTRSQEVRVMAAASHIVDLAVHAHFPGYLRRRLGVPPEAVLYAGGGNILLLVPSDLVDKVEKLAKEYSGGTGLRLVVASAAFTESYVHAVEELAVALHEAKHKVELSDSLEVKRPGPDARLCEMCFSDWATETVQTPEGERRVCGVCGRLYSVGSEHHFRPKWYAALSVAGESFSARDAFGKEWEDVSRWVVEIIAGHNPDELAEGVERVRDYAVIKFDGNAMGKFMLESVSFTDAIERSFRVDVALKGAYRSALEALYRGVERAAGPDSAKREVARVFLGTIYMGGDDGFLLAPSWAAALLAHVIAEEFSRQLGLARGLRVAVAAGPARMSLWALLSCANGMMKESKEALRRGDPTACEKLLGAVAFDVFESGSPSEASAVERMRRLSRRVRGWQPDEGIDGLQPYFIRRSDLEGSTVPELWEGLIPLVLGAQWSGARPLEAYARAFEVAYRASRGVREEDEAVKKVKESVRSLRNVILRSWSAVSPSRYWREKLVVYLLRQLSDGEREEAIAEAYERLAAFVKRSVAAEGVGPVPLADALTLIKLVKGGAW